MKVWRTSSSTSTPPRICLCLQITFCSLGGHGLPASCLIGQRSFTSLGHHLPPSPNLITLSGFVPNLISYMILAYYSPNLIETAPSWVYFLCVITLFLYQTLDALDGKQARRTGSSSPLGELFDHGCDALTTIVRASVCSLH